MEEQKKTTVAFAAEFHNKKFYCDAPKMGFIYQDDKIIKIVPGLWADQAGLRVGDQLVRIQTEFKTDAITESDKRCIGKDKTGEKMYEIINYTDFGLLSPKDKILRLKRKGGVGFIVNREVLEDDLHDKATKLQAVYRGKKVRKSIHSADENVNDCICFSNATDTRPATCCFLKTTMCGGSWGFCGGQRPESTIAMKKPIGQKKKASI